MIIETFVWKKYQDLRKQQQMVEKYGDDDNDGDAKKIGISAAILFVVWVVLLIMWIITIIKASKVRSGNKTGSILIAVFVWPVWWFVKWGGGWN